MPLLISASSLFIFLAMGAYFSKYRASEGKNCFDSLPDELILQIFRCVRETPIPDGKRYEGNDAAWSRYNQDTRDIGRLRLTCRRFNRISSELLIPFVGVDVSSLSLARFQTIMQHPTIGRGVDMIRIRLPAYDRVLYRHRGEYMDEIVQRLEFFGPRMTDRKAELVAHNYAAGWRRLQPTPSQQLVAVVRSSHQQYRQQYAEQQWLSNLFVSDVTEALKMSKKKLRVSITDTDDFWWPMYVSLISATRDNVLDLITEPRASKWEEHVRGSFGLPQTLVWMVPELLEAFDDDRIRIVELRLDFSKIHPSQSAPFSDERTERIQRTLRGLLKFQYHNSDYDGPGRRVPGPELKKSIYSCLPPASLQKLSLHSVQLEPLRQWPSLTTILLSDVRLDCRRLATLLRPIEPRTAVIWLQFCKLSHGSWADVLDLLRNMQQLVYLDWPRGGEVSRMSPEDRNYLFEHLLGWHEGANKAEQYVHGWWDTNPIRQITG